MISIQAKAFQRCWQPLKTPQSGETSVVIIILKKGQPWLDGGKMPLYEDQWRVALFAVRLDEIGMLDLSRDTGPYVVTRVCLSTKTSRRVSVRENRLMYEWMFSVLKWSSVLLAPTKLFLSRCVRRIDWFGVLNLCRISPWSPVEARWETRYLVIEWAYIE